ncbi:MAG: MFS transporter [Candidatus Hermodarchaeota archaeon]|nr:MFS transporter [Candidatus Hermodarchaeota archaeon]
MPDDQPITNNPQNQQPIRVSSLWASWQIGANLVWAYTGSLAVDLGASGIQQSTVTAVQTIGNASLQWAWGSLSDRFGRRPFLFLGLLAVGITAALIPLAQTAWQLIFLLLVPTIIGSAAIPAWNGLLGDITTLRGRGRFVGIITAIGTVASAFALVAIGYLATSLGLSGIAEYQVPMYTAAVVLGVSVIVVLVLTETMKPSKRRVFQLRSAMKSTPRFIPFLIINTLFFASMGAAWPLFPIVTRGILNVNLFFIGVFTAIFSISSGIAQLTGGWITDHYGRKPVLFVSRSAIFLVPVLHSTGAITGNMWFLIPSNILGGCLTGFFIVSSTAWLLDSSPVKHRGGVVALFNFCTGASSFLAAMVSGLILDYITLVIPYATAVILMMLIIAIIRLITSMGYLKVNETLVKTPAAPVPHVPAPARAG